MKIIKNIVFWVATVLVTVAIILVALPMLGQLEYRTIMSPSMEPDIPVGSLVIIKKTDRENIRVGDVITFASSGDIPITHKVVGYELSQDALITHGIANDEGVNEITPYKNVIGKVAFSIPWLGKPFLLISSKRGKIIAITIIAVLYIVSVFFETIGSKSYDDDEDDDEDKPNENKSKKKQRDKSKDKSDIGSEEIPSLGTWLNDEL